MPSTILSFKENRGTIVTIFAQPGSCLKNKPILSYHVDNSLKILKMPHSGIIEKIYVEAGDMILSGTPLCEIAKDTSCSHEFVIKDLCAQCGADLRSGDEASSSKPGKTEQRSFSLVHSVPALICTEQTAKIFGRLDQENLLKSRRLVLIVDLDHTLLHTTDMVVSDKLECVHHFRMWTGTDWTWYHTKFRPGLDTFLKRISQHFELHICTFGNRLYATKVAALMDSEGCYFHDRILSRDELLDANSKTANLRSLFPIGDQMVCIIDDRPDVWNNIPNLIPVRPYIYFDDTHDINAPDRPAAGSAPPICDGKPPSVDFKAQISQSSSAQSSEPDPNSTCTATEPSCTATNNQLPNDGSPVTFFVECDQSAAGPPDAALHSAADSNMGVLTEANESGSKVKTMDVQRFNRLLDNASRILSDASVSVTRETHSEPNLAMTEDLVEEKYAEKSCSNSSDATISKEQASDVCDSATTSPSAPIQSDMTCSKSIADKNAPVAPRILRPDADDYLLRLEQILLHVHHAFYALYDYALERHPKTRKAVDLKRILPYLRRQILRRKRITFSGVIPHNMPLQKCHIYKIAVEMGAEVQEAFVAETESQSEWTTHVIAAKWGTNKLRQATRANGSTSGKVHVVSPAWLWACWETWSAVDETPFRLTKHSASTPDLHRDGVISGVRKRRPLPSSADTPKRMRNDDSVGASKGSEVATIEAADECSVDEHSKQPPLDDSRPPPSPADSPADQRAAGLSSQHWPPLSLDNLWRFCTMAAIDTPASPQFDSQLHDQNILLLSRESCAQMDDEASALHF